MIDEAAKAFAVGDAAFRRCAHAGEFIATDVLPAILPSVMAGTADEVIVAQLVRIDYWLRSLGKLASPTDYQAVTAGCRAMLECAIDIVLVRANPADFQKVLEWEESAKLKHAEALATYCQKDKDNELADRFERPIKWAAAEGARVNALRIKHGWVEKRKDGTDKPNHPDRWTSRDLGSDAREADKVQAQWTPAEGPPIRLERFYETRYRELCWDTHGSGNIRRLVRPELVPVIGAKAFYDSARISLVAASWVARHLRQWDDAMAAKFDSAAGTMERIYQATLKAHGIEVPEEDR